MNTLPSQMASIFKLLSLILFLGLVSKGDAEQCSFRNISIRQSGDGNWAHGMPEWKVSITNKCGCSQSQVKLKCDGFQTYKDVDPLISNVVDDVCIVKDGKPISPSETVEFLYAWDPKFPFQPISSIVQCN